MLSYVAIRLVRVTLLTDHAQPALTPHTLSVVSVINKFDRRRRSLAAYRPIVRNHGPDVTDS
jgi:hypothetical protein